MRRALAIAVLVPLAGCGAPAAHLIHRRAPAPAPAPVPAAVPRRPTVVAQRAALRRLLRIGRPVFCGGRHGRMVALTFDDGPGPYTHLAMKELRRGGAHGTFFLVGRVIRRFPGLPRREKAYGALGDHTNTHPFLPGLPAAAARHEIAAGQIAAARAAGQAIRLFRPPYGSSTPAITRDARRRGMVEVQWSIDSGDSISGDFHVIAARVRAAIRPGSIVLMHENRGQTIRALRSLLPWLRRHHLHAVSVPELLAADPPSAAQLGRGENGCPAPTPRRPAVRGARASAPRSRAAARRGRRGAARPRRRGGRPRPRPARGRAGR